MATKEAGGVELVYRISTAEEWEELQKNGSTFGGELDKNTGFIHLSKLDQVMATLRNFFQGRDDLYLLVIDPLKLGKGLVYEAVDDFNSFPHFYGPSRSFDPLPFDAIIKVEKVEMISGEFSCSLLK
ncbi:dihydroorotate dehydrogenase [Tasmannia lanceolata]|uniref:dihydroorotate dehydrogenase n=1 Tax=Tasmannia lanceolata TaxID=3420 RepID=UPI0040636868